jgi:hypothetical protein
MKDDPPDEVMTEILRTKLSSPGFRVFPKRKAVLQPLPKNEKNRQKNKRAKESRKRNR